MRRWWLCCLGASWGSPWFLLSQIEGKLRAKFKSVSNAKRIGAYKTLVTFESKEMMEKCLIEDKHRLIKFCDEVREWSMEEVCQTRRVCVECYGVPLHAWSVENFKRIGD